MIEYIIFLLSFVGLWITLIWINVLFYKPEEIKTKTLQTITIAIPAYNEEQTIEKTLKSLINMNYPKEKLEIIVVNDGSKDQTSYKVNKFINKNKQFKIILIEQENKGKAEAINTALRNAKGELFGCLDADTTVSKDIIKNILKGFDEDNIAAVISVVKVESPKTILEKIQRVEYIMCNLGRRLMSVINTLGITHGALSLFNKKILQSVGGFSKDSGLTEDLEVAMRLRYNNYKVKMQWNAVSKTKVPKTLNVLWRQRIRWFRGFIYNNWKYKDMFFKTKYGAFGVFQLPINIVSRLLSLLIMTYICYELITRFSEHAIRILKIKGYLINHVLDIPNIKEFILSYNIQFYLPITLSTILGTYIMYVAHRQIKEHIFRHLHTIGFYLIIFPYLNGLYWFSALLQEITNIKRKWR